MSARRPDAPGPVRSGRRRRSPITTAPARSLTLVLVAALVALLGPLALRTEGRLQDTTAAWTAEEWNHGALGYCMDGQFSVRSSGRFLEASVLGVNLRTAANLSPMIVLDDWGTTMAYPAVAPVPGSDGATFANPLTVTVLSAVGANLTNLIQLPLQTETGAYNQVANAHGTGMTWAASGAVADSGAGVVLNVPDPSARPDVATIDLRRLLNTVPGLGTQVGNQITDLRLHAGALSGFASLDACEGTTGMETSRSYHVEKLTLDLTSNALRAVSTAAGTAVTTANTALGTALGQLNIVGAVTSGLTAAINTLGLGYAITVNVATPTITLTLPAALIDGLRTSTLGNATALQVNLSNGTVAINLEHYIAGGLNGRPPNTEVLTAPVLTAIQNDLAALLGTWRQDLLDLVWDQSTVSISTTATIGLAGFTLLSAAIGFTDGAGGPLSLRDIANSNISSQVSLSLLSCNGNIPCGVVRTALQTVLGTTGGLAALNAVARTAINTALNLATAIASINTAIGTLSTALNTATTAAITEIAPVLTLLRTALSLQLNAQPDQPGHRPHVYPLRVGELAVSALRIGAVNAGANVAGAVIHLGTATAGTPSHGAP